MSCPHPFSNLAFFILKTALVLGVLKVWLHTYNPKPFSKIPLYFARHFLVLLISKKVKNNTGRMKSIGKSVYSDMKWAPRTGGKTLIQRPDQADQRRGPKTQQNDQEAFLLGKILEEEKVLLNCSAPEVAILCRGHHGQEEEEVTQMTPIRTIQLRVNHCAMIHVGFRPRNSRQLKTEAINTVHQCWIQKRSNSAGGKPKTLTIGATHSEVTALQDLSYKGCLPVTGKERERQFESQATLF